MMPKFRAWDKELKCWCPYRIYSLEKLGDDIVEFMYIPQGIWYTNEELFDNFVLMQSTGLKDKNGVEIYEGDILKHIDFSLNEVTVNVVYMKHGALLFDVKVDEFVYDVPVYSLHQEVNKGYEDSLEVIGNIWEHNELLGDNNGG